MLEREGGWGAGKELFKIVILIRCGGCPHSASCYQSVSGKDDGLVDTFDKHVTTLFSVLDDDAGENLLSRTSFDRNINSHSAGGAVRVR